MGYIESTISGGEKVEFKFSYYWIMWITPVVGILLTPVTVGISLLYSIYYSLKIIFTEQGVTTKKGFKKEGVISRNTEELLLSKVETIEIKQGI
jgi:uncharacterized membrane protein